MLTMWSRRTGRGRDDKPPKNESIVRLKLARSLGHSDVRFRPVLLRVVVVLSLTLALLEIGSRVTCCELWNWDARTHYDVASAQLQVWTPGVPGYRWKPDAFLDGRPFTNNMGLVMDHDLTPTPAAGVHRLIAIGASTTQGDPPEDAYPRQLQALLDAREPGKWEVVNAGHSGYTIEATLALLTQKLVELHPDVLVYYGEINDLIVRQFLANPSASHNLEFEFLQQHSALWHFYLAPVVDPHLGMGTDSVDWSFILERWGWERSLGRILDVAHDTGARVVLTTYAYGPQPGQPLTAPMRRIADVGWPALRDPVRQYREGVAAENAIVNQLATERGVPVADVATRLDGHLDDFVDLIHLTRSGYGVLAESVADTLPAAAVPRDRSDIARSLSTGRGRGG